jgi:hypothetical protein
MSSSISHKIKKRDTPKDVFITPLDLAYLNIEMIEDNNYIWYDPFMNSGSYFNQFPNNGKEHKWSEILENKDFFDFNENIDVICSNPPYSIIDKVLKKSVELKPIYISYLIGQGNLTSKRIEFMNDNGYFLQKLHMCKVWKWYGMSYIVVFKKGDGENCMTFDRTVWK